MLHHGRLGQVAKLIMNQQFRAVVPAASEVAGRAGTAEQLLSAIVCPLTPRELPTALKNLKSWEQDARPCSNATDTSPRLIFSFSCGESPKLREPLIQEYARCPSLRNYFSQMEVSFCDLPPEKDVYVRGTPDRPLPFGNKAGPNWLFYETIKSLRQTARFVFLMETDCTPVVPDWISTLAKVCLHYNDAWIVGSHYRGVSPLHWALARHINGNAL